MSAALPPLRVCFCQDAQVLHKNPALHMPKWTDGSKSECQEFAANSEFGFCLGYFVCNCCKCFDWLRLVRMCWFAVASNFLQALSILTVLWAIKSGHGAGRGTGVPGRLRKKCLAAWHGWHLLQWRSPQALWLHGWRVAFGAVNFLFENCVLERISWSL